MSDHDPEVPAVPEVRPADDATPSDLLPMPDAVLPLAVEPRMLVRGLRYLQQRIPDYVQLSVDEAHSMLRAASLDPEFVSAGLGAADVWHETKAIVGESAEELHLRAEEIELWDTVERELLVLAKGVAHANLKRKHHLGQAVLRIYSILRITINNPERSHLRPYLDAMRKAYLKRRRKSRKPKTEEATAPEE